MNDFSPWLRHTVIGPFASCFGLVTFLHFTFGEQAVLSEFHWDSWLVAMMLVGFFAAGMVVNLIVADVLLLRLKMRALPTGWAGWAGSMAAPIAVFFVWNMFEEPSSVLGNVVRIVLPMLVVAHTLRFALGVRP